MERNEVKCIAIVGPSASGKSSLARRLSECLGRDKCVIICQDNYYKDWSQLSLSKRKRINFDDYKAFDFGLLNRHLRCLKKGEPILSPLYDFVKSRRLKKTKKVGPKQFIIVEGLMLFRDKKMRGLFDYKIYVDSDNALCLARRIERDTKERGDSIESVCRRYFKDVMPMRRRFVEAQRRWADLVVTRA